MSRASEQANGQASGPVLQSVFLADIDHSEVVILVLLYCPSKKDTVPQMISTYHSCSLTGQSLTKNPASVLMSKESMDGRTASKPMNMFEQLLAIGLVYLMQVSAYLKRKLPRDCK